MVSKIVNRRDLDFLLYEVMDSEALCERERFRDHDRSTFDAVIETAQAIAENHFATHAHKLDENEPSFDGERVHLIEEVAEAIGVLAESGLMAAHCDEELGGMQLPWTVVQAAVGMVAGANPSTAGYPFLTSAAANLIAAFGTEEQKDRYMKPMFSGRFFGTMCLSEPHAGSSLGDITTRAVPNESGDYHISGTKMWISGGEHEMGENIVHLVLARIPGGPAGVKGISLFIVPKRVLDDSGACGELNNVTLAGLNHKMGYRGTVNTLLNFGEAGPCKGYLLGKPHCGLQAMFHMMNEARIAVGLSSSMIGYGGYLHALDYARNRPQGRAPENRDPTTPQSMIVEHADVKRMLLAQKSYVEGALSLCFYAARLVDDERTHPDAAESQKATALLGILTPICKAWPAKYCTEANDLAIQVLGGAGYTRDHPVERMYRDNRLNPIHEGTNGIQAMDLLGRKVTANAGEALRFLMGEVNVTIEEARAHPALTGHADALGGAVQMVAKTTMVLIGAGVGGEISLFLANAWLYLEMLGHVVIAWMWLKQGVAASGNLPEAGEADRRFYEGKMRACDYFYRWELPKIAHSARLLAELDRTCLDTPSECL